MKRLAFCGRSLAALSDFPEVARRKAGYQLSLVQEGLEPDDWKPMASIGPGVREIRIRDAGGAFRLIYTAAFQDVIFVLHAFQKKTQRTALLDIELARTRFRQLSKEFGK